MAEHVCRCRRCHPEPFPSGPRQGPDHTALRFKTDRKEAETTTVEVFLNGNKVLLTTEALAGPNGFVVHFCAEDDRATSVHRCSCEEGACEEVLHGNVEIKKEARAIWATTAKS